MATAPHTLDGMHLNIAYIDRWPPPF